MRRLSRDPQPCAVYRHFDDRGILLYVGVTANLKQRWRNHYASWKPLVARTDVEWFGSRRQALTAEAELIRTLVPVFNQEHNMDKLRPLAALYLTLRDALPDQPALIELQRRYPVPRSDERYWTAIEAQRCKVLHAFGVVDDETPLLRPARMPQPTGLRGAQWHSL